MEREIDLRHIAIIPDGNRRWARARRLFPWQGHEVGVKRFWELSDYITRTGLEYITFWAGSYDNLHKRSQQEISVLFRLLKDELSRQEVKRRFAANNAKFQMLGEWGSFPQADDSLKEVVSALQDETGLNSGPTVTLLFGYDGRREMLDAISRVGGNGNKISGDNLRESLWTGGLPDVDLVIRTGGEPHWSAGFMMWLTANSQFYFTDLLWPDFDVEQLKTAIETYNRRERRLGQ